MTTDFLDLCTWDTCHEKKLGGYCGKVESCPGPGADCMKDFEYLRLEAAARSWLGLNTSYGCGLLFG